MKTVADTMTLDRYMNAPEEGDNVRPASDWLEDVLRYYQGETKLKGATLGWPKTHDKIRFTEGGTTLWLGINGHGKSLVTSQAQLDFMFAGEKCGLASMEMRPWESMQRMTRQAFAASDVGMEFIRKFHRWTDGKLWIYDVHGQLRWERVIACGRYMASLGVRHFFIDSLMKCVQGEDDYNGQKNFVNDLCALGKETGMHCHLIHHSKKLQDESKQPGKFDAKGAGAITDQVDNVVTIWRNKTKEKARAAGKNFKLEDPDMLMICDKQRHGEWEGSLGFWFHQGATQFLERGNMSEPKYYFDQPQEEIY